MNELTVVFSVIFAWFFLHDEGKLAIGTQHSLHSSLIVWHPFPVFIEKSRLPDSSNSGQSGRLQQIKYMWSLGNNLMLLILLLMVKIRLKCPKMRANLMYDPLLHHTQKLIAMLILPPKSSGLTRLWPIQFWCPFVCNYATNPQHCGFHRFVARPCCIRLMLLKSVKVFLDVDKKDKVHQTLVLFIWVAVRSFTLHYLCS